MLAQGPGLAQRPLWQQGDAVTGATNAIPIV